MTHATSRYALAWFALLLGCLAVPLAASAAPTSANTGWSRLATVSPGTAIVVTLSDGRRLQRYIVSADSNALVVADLSRLRSNDRRNALVELLRNEPTKFVASTSVEEGERRLEIVERFERQSILMVARPRPYRFEPGVLGWFLARSGPCPNCDAAQTMFGSTVLPSPLKRTAAPGTTGEVLYAALMLPASDLPDVLTWPRLHEWLSLQKPEKKAPPTVTGKWAMTLEMSMGTGTPTLDLKQEGEKITGTYTGRYGTFDLQGTLKERTIQFSFNMSAEGQSVTMSFTGEVAADGQTMKGTATLGEMGDATWSAKKDKSTP
jgi:hypothetical protein